MGPNSYNRQLFSNKISASVTDLPTSVEDSVFLKWWPNFIHMIHFFTSLYIDFSNTGQRWRISRDKNTRIVMVSHINLLNYCTFSTFTVHLFFSKIRYRMKCYIVKNFCKIHKRLRKGHWSAYLGYFLSWNL